MTDKYVYKGREVTMYVAYMILEETITFVLGFIIK